MTFAVCVQSDFYKSDAKRCAIGVDGVVAVTALVVGVLGFCSVIQLPLAASASLTAFGSALIIADIVSSVIKYCRNKVAAQHKVEIKAKTAEYMAAAEQVTRVREAAVQGNYATAKIEARKLNYRNERSRAFRLIVIGQVDTNDLAGAKETAKEITDPFFLAEACIKIFKKEPSKKYFDKAEKASKKILDTGDRSEIEEKLNKLRSSVPLVEIVE